MSHRRPGWQRQWLGFQIKESASCFSHLKFDLQMLKGKPSPLELRSRTLGKKEHVKSVCLWHFRATKEVAGFGVEQI